MANGIYDLIMMSNTIVPIKYEFLSTAFLFWNNEINTFDFIMGLMTSTILDMAQVFSLRSSGRCVNIMHDWSSPSRLTTKISEVSKSTINLEYNSTTFKSYETSFPSFIPFANKMFNPPSPIADLG